MSFRELTNEQVRQLIDLEQVYKPHTNANREMQLRFAGSMQWKTVKGHDYLYRRTKRACKTIGVRSPDSCARSLALQGREGKRVRRSRKTLTS